MATSAHVLYQKYADNVAPLATITAPTGTVASAPYGLTALVDDNPAKLFKFTTTSGSLQFAYVAKQPLQNVGLIHSNCDAGLTVQIMGDNAANWAAPAFSANITIPTWLATGTTRAWPINPWLDLEVQPGYSALGFFYWLLKFGTNSQAIQLGLPWLGATNRRLSPNIQWGTKPVEDKPAIENVTNARVSTIYSYGTSLWENEGDVRHTDAQRTAIREQWYDVDGRRLPFLLVPDGTKNVCYLVRWKTTSQEMQENFVNHTTMHLAFQELSRGLRPGV